ncbi:hypothetical protein [Bacillus sinesaloumensis]|uniref:hypothetical protein n=1 Tax=Litchfieldia sinesaloumensis TaxID=1926280 RepID=UPI0009884148|nr:hypothetical protein [Bacillus sinesaloumensis]
MPIYQSASFGGKTVSLGNEHIRVDIHKRLTGWGWVEIFSADGAYLGVIDHFGEVMLRDQEIPIRLEAEDYEKQTGDFGEKLIFHVKSMIVQDKLNGTSFEQWIKYPFGEHCLEGVVILWLKPNSSVIELSFRFEAKANLFVRYVRGPWLKIGANGSGVKKEDAIFPGIEWLQADEWSSGTDWFKDPWAQRFAPHHHKVAIPMMTVSNDNHVISLSWNPNQTVTQWFNYRKHVAQPVFASPNFIDRMNNHLLGLMVPNAATEEEENKVYANPVLELHPGQPIEFDAELSVGRGNSLDGVIQWVERNGLPDVPEPRWSLAQALDRIAHAYNTHLWFQGKGFGTKQTDNGIKPIVPRFIHDYLEMFPEKRVSKELEENVNWCKEQPDYHQASFNLGKVASIPLWSQEKQVAYGRELLDYQNEDGSFSFEPDGRHYQKDDFVVAREFLEPMAQSGETALDISIIPAAELLTLWKNTGNEIYKKSAVKTLDYCLNMRRPEGGDFWETPLHSPNLLAAGHAAITYYLAFQEFGDEKYKNKAVYWLRSLLPFTHLWQPDGMQMVYNTKPCFCSSDWYFANWVRDHVQWEVLETFAASSALEIDWNALDAKVDWEKYQEGITVAALRWMLNHEDKNWQPHNLPITRELYKNGELDECFADTHNSITGHYGGMAILPDVIAVNLVSIIKRNR